MKSSTTLAALVAYCHKLARRHQAPDAELLSRFAGHRDAAAFEELMERYAPLVWGVCRRMLLREADCEDAFQATFLVLVRRASSIAPDRPLGAWLHTVAVHVSDKTRARALRQPRQTITSEPATRGDVAEELGNRELFRIVDEEIARLPAQLRAPFILCCLEGRTRDEAAAALDCTVAAIKSRLERSRNLLRRRLEQRGISLPAAFLVLGLTIPHVRASLQAKAMQCILGSTPPAVAALVPAAASSLARKLALTGMSAVVVGALGFGALRVMQVKPPQETPAQNAAIAPHPPEPAAAEKPQSGHDGFGDPLPEGAIRRFGTLRFRHPRVDDLAFTSDGKQLIVGGCGSSFGVFDVATGRKLRELGKNSSLVNDWTGFALSPDDKLLAAYGSDVFLCDVESGRLIRRFHYNNRCHEVAFSPDGNKIATIKEISTQPDESLIEIAIEETATGKQVGQWKIQEGQPMRFSFNRSAFSPDRKFLAGEFSELRKEKPFVWGSASSQVWLFDIATGKRVRTFGADSAIVACFAFQPRSGRLATYGKDGVLRFWEVATGKEVQRFQVAKGKEENAFGNLRFSADGRRCALLTERAKYLTVLDTRSGRVIRRIEGRNYRMKTALALSADGGTVATSRVYDEPCVRVWDVDSGAERLAKVGHRAAAIALSLSADGRTLVSQDEEGRQITWDLATGRGEVRPSDRREEVGRLIWSFDFDERTLRSPRWRLVHKNQEPAWMEVWSQDGTKLIRKADAPTQIASHALSPDGRCLALATVQGPGSAVLFWEPEREKKPRWLQGIASVGGPMLFSHDGKQLITGSGQFNNNASSLGIWNVATGRILHKLAISRPAGHLLLTANDRVLFAGCMWNDATVYAWDTETGRELARMVDPSLKPAKEKDPQRQPAITGLALSDDERFLAVVSSSGEISTVNVWETASWKLVRSFAPIPIQSRNDVKAMVFSRDGRSLFVANSDSTILEWDVSGQFGKKTQNPNQDRLNVLWRMLTETPDKAYPAVWEMLDHPAQSLPFLKDKLTPVQPIEEKRVRQLLAQLDSDSFEERETANRQLLALGEQFLPILRQTLKDRPTPEAKKRVEEILELLARGPLLEQLRLLRALAVLEWSNRPEAVERLGLLASGAPSASLTQAAKAAVRRLQKR